MYKIFLGIILSGIVFNARSQITKINGVIYDLDTKEPVPFVTITFKGSNIGTISDINGTFYFETREATDSIVISSVGYISQKQEINIGSFQNITIYINHQPLQV